MTNKKSKDQASDISKELNAGSKRTKNLLQTYKTGTLLTLTIDEIDFYDKNPRITKNDKYDEVYVSIQAKGLEGTLSVSQRPDNDDPQKFLLFRGGNTRLAALKALYDETKDKKYYEVNALFHEWVSESDTLIGHLTENDSRGDYVFIDRALGVRESKLELEKETNDTISDKGLIKQLADQGYKISSKDLRRMNYAVDIMYPHCPSLLASGIGPFQLDAIKKLNVKAAELCLEIDPDKKPEFFTQQFASALAKLEESYLLDIEKNSYSYQTLYDAVLKILSNEKRITANRLEYFLDNRINAKADQQKAFDPDYVEADDKSITAEGTKQSTQQATASKQESPSVKTSDSSDVDGSDELENTTSQQSSIDASSDNKEELNQSHVHTSNVYGIEKETSLHPVTLDYSVSQISENHKKTAPWERENDFDPDFTYLNNLPISCGDKRELAPLPDDISSLRSIMYEKAILFQQYLYIPGEIICIDDGMGYTLKDIPPFEQWIAISDEHQHDRPRHRNPLVGFMDKPLHGWWALLGFSNLMVLAHANFDWLKTVMPAGNLYDYFVENHKIIQHEKLIFQHKVHFGHTYDLINLFLSRAEPKEFQLFIELQLVNNKIFNLMNGDIWGLGIKR